MEISVFGDTYALNVNHIDADPAEIRRQVREYEMDERRTFDLEVIYPDGFRGEVMQAMVAIPYGETRTYGELATLLDSSAQAVGQSCGANPIPIVVPCHRVVGADSLGGFSAQGGINAKRTLLAFEGSHGTQSSLDQYTLDGDARRIS